jgi:hypothetical protein
MDIVMDVRARFAARDLILGLEAENGNSRNGS